MDRLIAKGIALLADAGRTLGIAFNRRPTDDEMRKIHDLLHDPDTLSQGAVRDEALAVPLKPDIEWLRKVAALCPGMDGTEDMVGVVRGVHGAILATALKREPNAAARTRCSVSFAHPPHDYCDGNPGAKFFNAASPAPASPDVASMVMVPREPTDAIVWAICEHSDAPIDRERCLRCPAKEPTYYGEGTRGCRALAEDQFRAMLSAAEAEGRKG